MPNPTLALMLNAVDSAREEPSRARGGIAWLTRAIARLRGLRRARRQLETDRVRMRALAIAVLRGARLERSALGRELHDSMAQALVALIYQLSVAHRASHDPLLTDQLATMHRMASRLLKEVQTLARTVYPRVLDDLGLFAALNTLVRPAGTSDDDDIDIRVMLMRGSEKDVRALRREYAYVLYCVAQEAVRNALRHGNPSQVTVILEIAPDVASIRITDDGSGFEPRLVLEGQAETGLLMIRERIWLANGTFDVVSAVGQGASVFARVPLAETLSIQ